MTYIACILWTIGVALWSAANDAEQIALNERIHHGRQWFIRAALVFLVCVCAGLPLFAVPMGALFSMVFRFVLNRLRGLDWRYVSPSSWYDWVFIWTMTPAPSEGGKLRHLFNSHTRNGANIVHGQFMEHRPDWVVVIHRAGLLAYISELSFAVLIFVLFV